MTRNEKGEGRIKSYPFAKIQKIAEDGFSDFCYPKKTQFFYGFLYWIEHKVKKEPSDEQEVVSLYRPARPQEN